jgi:SAM-dependent methyltransferase
VCDGRPHPAWGKAPSAPGAEEEQGWGNLLRRMAHRDVVHEQFTRQAVPFSEAPSMADEAAIGLLLEASGASPGQHSLDVACGPGLVVLAFSKVVARAVGLDTTPAMIERARALQAQRERRNVEWHLGDVYRLPFPDGSFDVVTCRFAFHHLERPGAALAEMSRVARADGVVVVCDGVASDDPAKAAALNEMERLRDPSTVRFLTLAELGAIFDAAGLRGRSERRYRVPAELEALLRTSFPAEGDAERVRRLIEGSVATDALGLGTFRKGDRVLFGYPAVILAARRGAL